ncbi:origin recognition complex subunit 2-like isoform X2 [Dreissena polymorpha]|uniref:origin recognition complex subunit 2-like isoform X2 n=1 Tax=Dreissena polymorpha TaxID=45954 RepID=UPI002264DE8A|nr:origin recognition complex subunit 2-like isoform X2 [Dreissena polymorpha]
MSDRKLRRKSAIVTFAGDDEVLQHIVDAENNSTRESKSRRRSHPQVKQKTIEEEASDHSDDENLPVTKSQALEDDSQVSGGDVFGFRTPKKAGRMEQLASEAKTPKSILKTPKSKEGTPRKSVGFTPSKEEPCTPTSKTLRQRKPAASTPYRLHKRHGAGNSDSEDSLDTSDSDSDDNEGAAPSVPTTPSGSATRAARRKMDEVDVKTNVEEYFDIHASDTGPTSDATLAKLDMPHLDHKSLNALLTDVLSSHAAECRLLYEEYTDMFRTWMYQMCNGFNILLYGFGSKRRLLEGFRETVLKGFSNLVVNGYFPSLSVKHILNSITEEILDHNGSFKSPLDQVEFIKQQFDKSGDDFYLIIHNIDGTMLRNEKTQNILSLLSLSPHIHILASVDHINSSLIWDQTKCCRFRWLWYDATTFAPYMEETSYENSLLVQQTGGLALSSLTHVMKSLTPNARGIFLLLATYQMENKDNNNYIGMSLQDLYQYMPCLLKECFYKTCTNICHAC